MAARKQKEDREDKKARKEEEDHRPRPFWSGVIAFGLVTLPVSLFPANRGRSVAMNMVDDQGNRLRRRYYCEREERIIDREDIVRGYPLDQDRFVIIEDEDLESLAPEKTREIDLRRFVPLSEVNPVYFERGYFLAPDSDATKAYRLLAKTLEEEERAGIATFVMRDKEYIVAIMAEGGILRAETLRFHDEIRSPEQVGLPDDLEQPASKLKQQMLKAMEQRAQKRLDPATLTEQQTERLKALVDWKLAEHQDVIEEPAPEESGEAESNVVDLMQVLKERLRGEASPGEAKQGRAGKSAPESEQLNRDQLYEKAREQHIPGRSKMTKQELVQALRRAG